ncbi:hypothetical protein LZ198_38735 [Myxococcus sp. K15C18031901]|uniref:hypothetical protein n=1 Tax=Myxococcus dinghuensis TaxID=2906761 RepID=UPI0020A6ECDD|nr:hypothetical protein [Myxococcus dinghuensis]MCP3104819.1 hypothetical protein [Myxococcus dinghuensis]
MGVHDYRCSVCDTPTSYDCGEARGQECEESGIGNDEAVLDLFFFREADAPGAPEDFEDARGRARRVQTLLARYDWGAWEFQPGLNYRELLMDDGDRLGIWAIRPFDEDAFDGGPVEVDIPDGERVWVVNYCPPCRALFVDRRGTAQDACGLYLEAVAEGLGLRFEAGASAEQKQAFIEDVRQRVLRRLPVTRAAST